jgi:CubicO group peptidase (beta-lactamase class C family)
VEASVARHVDDVAPANPNWNAGYGYQWWRLDRDGIEVWAGLGYGGQYLLVLPEQRIVAVANSWNVFGPNNQVLGAFLTALIESAGG